MNKVYLLDTNIVSEFTKDNPNQKVIALYTARKNICAISFPGNVQKKAKPFHSAIPLYIRYVFCKRAGNIPESFKAFSKAQKEYAEERKNTAKSFCFPNYCTFSEFRF